MTRAPLRTALRALSTSIGLSLALLAVSSFSARTQLPPPASLSSDGPGETSPEDVPPQSVGTDASAQESDNETNAGSSAAIVARPSSVPVNVISHPEKSALAIGLEEVLNPVSGSGVFIALPPPPEYAEPVAERSAPDATLEELAGRLQTGFDDLHREFDRLHLQFTGMQGQFSDELTAVQSSHGEMRLALTELVAAANARHEPPPQVEIDVTVLLMPLRGDARDGALPLMSRQFSDVRPSRSPAVSRIRWGTSVSGASTLKSWLQLHGPAQIEQGTSLQLEQQAVTELELSHSMVRGMLQARGAELRERTVTLPWEGPLAIRAGTSPRGLVTIEWRVAGADWGRAAVSPGGTLILTVVLDEVYRPHGGLPSGGGAAAAASRRPAGTEVVALLQPRLLRAPASAPPRDVAAPFPLLNDGPATR